MQSIKTAVWLDNKAKRPLQNNIITLNQKGNDMQTITKEEFAKNLTAAIERKKKADEAKKAWQFKGYLGDLSRDSTMHRRRIGKNRGFTEV